MKASISITLTIVALHLVTVTANGMTVFSDDFDGVPAPGNPPVADIGTWVGYSGLEQVIDAPSPGAFSGTQYLQQGPTGGWSTTTGELIAPETGRPLTIEAMYYLPSGPSASFAGGVALLDTAGKRFLSLSHDSGRKAYDAMQDTQPDVWFEADAWNRIKIEFTPEPFDQGVDPMPTYALEVENTAYGLQEALVSGFRSYNGLADEVTMTVADNGRTIYWDEVSLSVYIPEPGCLALLGLAGLLCLRRRR